MIRSNYVGVAVEESADRANALIEWLREYSANRLSSKLIDERRCIPPHVAMDFASQGLFGLQVEERFGGLALRNRDIARVLQALGGVDLSLATWVTTAVFPGIRPIATFGSERLRNQHLRNLAEGRVFGAYAQTELGAGSDFTKLTATARPVEGGWLLTGEKVWIGNGGWSGVITVIARTCDHSGESSELGAFAVETKSKGVTIGEEFLSMGLRGMVQSKLSFTDVFVPHQNVLGQTDGGLMVGVDSMMFTRFALTACALGSMKRALQLSLRYASRRQISTGRLGDHPIFRREFERLSNSVHGVENLLFVASEALDSSDGAPFELLVACKLVSSEVLWECADHLVQTLGARGYDEANPAAQLLRDARVFRIFEGASEALADFLGSRATLGEGAAQGGLPSTHETDTVFARLAKVSRQVRAELKEKGWKQRLLVNHSLGRAVCSALILAASKRQPSGLFPNSISQFEMEFDRDCMKCQNLTDAGDAFTPTDVLSAWKDLIPQVEQVVPNHGSDMDILLFADGQQR